MAHSCAEERCACPEQVRYKFQFPRLKNHGRQLECATCEEGRNMYLPAGVVVVILTLSFVSRGHWKSPCVKHFCCYSFYFLFLLFLLIHLILLNLILLLLLLLLHLILKSCLSMTSPNPIWPFFWLLCPRNELWDNKSTQVRGSWRDCCICVSCNEAVSNWLCSIESHLSEGSNEATENVGQSGRCQAEIERPPPSLPTRPNTDAHQKRLLS